MFIYSIKKNSDQDKSNHSSLEDSKYVPKSEYFRFDPLYGHTPYPRYSLVRPVQGSVQNNSLRRLKHTATLKRNEQALNNSDMDIPQIHSLKKRLQQLEDSQVKENNSEDDYVPTFSQNKLNFANPQASPNSKFQAIQKHYYMNGGGRVEAEQYIQEFQTKLQSFLKNEIKNPAHHHTEISQKNFQNIPGVVLSSQNSQASTINSSRPSRVIKPFFTNRKEISDKFLDLGISSTSNAKSYLRLMAAFSVDKFKCDEIIYPPFQLKPTLSGTAENQEPPPSRKSNIPEETQVPDTSPAQRVFTPKKKYVQALGSLTKNSVVRIQPIDKQASFNIKLTLYWDFIHVVNLGNEQIVTPLPKETFQTYKAVITKANNGAIVRGCLKYRWWWQLADKDEPQEKIQLLWTSWKKTKFVKSLKTTKVNEQQNIILTPSEENGLPQKNLMKNRQRENEARSMKRVCLRQLLNDEQAECIKQRSKKFYTRSGSESLGPFVFDSMEKGLLQFALEFFPDVDYKTITPNQHWKLHNHLERNSLLHSKKHLLNNLKQYYRQLSKIFQKKIFLDQNPFEWIPLTFHITNGNNDREFTVFKETYKKLKYETDNQNKMGGSVWIIKPGENSNRGIGIQVCQKLQDIQNIITQKDYHTNGKRFTYIIQKYIERPMLFNKRKFDIRCYMLITAVNGRIKGYWYKDGYVRTSSKEYSLKNLENRLVHLTNDAVQKKCEDYGKYEYGNKVSLEDFQRYLDKNGYEINFFTDTFPRMGMMALDAIRSVFHKLDPFHRVTTFELFGLDFMLDESGRPWLIEFNANPCLEISCSVLNRIIPHLIENVWRIAIDPLFPPPINWPKSKQSYVPDNPYQTNKFDLIFDETVEKEYLNRILKLESPSFIQQEELSDDDVCDDD